MELKFKTPLKRTINIVKNDIIMAHFSYNSTFYQKVKESPRIYIFLCLLPFDEFAPTTIYEELIIGYEPK